MRINLAIFLEEEKHVEQLRIQQFEQYESRSVMVHASDNFKCFIHLNMKPSAYIKIYQTK
jgi:hypothetical protein